MSKEKPLFLVVEDELLILEAICERLRTLKVGFVSCETGEQAFKTLELLESRPDAIWLDYYLKDMNGEEFMQRLNQNSNWKKIPVIVVSNYDDKTIMDKMKDLGVKKYILKSSKNVQEIVNEINSFL